MLKRLSVQNYALISKLEIDFQQGFSVITGETGAGKSIIMGALSLILGQRADTKTLKQGANKCIIEGSFDISEYKLQDFFAERDLDFDSTDCTLRREISESGKSRAFINDTPVSLNDLKELGSYLIDIHSQHQNLMLSNNNFQLEVLDTIAKNKTLKNDYVDKYKTYKSLQSRLKALEEKAKQHSTEQDYILFQYNQLEEANLTDKEQAKLEEERDTLCNLEDIKRELYIIEQSLDSERGIVALLKDSLNASNAINNVFAQSKDISERLQSAYIDLKDLAQEINRQNEDLELDPNRLDFINEQLDLIYSLQKKHNVNTVEELIEIQNSLSSKIQEIENYDDEIAKLTDSVNKAFDELNIQAEKLSDSRKQAITQLEKDLINKVSTMGMPNMQFVASHSIKDKADITGIDEINFLFTANKNGELKPVAQTASGGEISRLMLGIKALIAGVSSLPTIIFDEIDTGVSGEIADKMSNIMYDMGQVMQVITITHLPQIAAKGQQQYFVYKEDSNERTETNIRLLSTDERIKDIAQMLSGSKLTDAAIENAKELLKLNNNIK
ncbi:DNA repair protein RecN (Recombination protein N) [Dysgonomonadaceae bacterium PH5-43]|nr:DNA repair protein RecN (Recombination protein N) [Dysgonomonadaceae bacterium PH5-43]